MLAGRNVKPQVIDELCSIICIFPMIASVAGVKVNPQEGREFALTDTLHPNQPYLVAISDDEYIFRFKTKMEVTNNTLVDLEQYEAMLLDKNDLSDVSNDNEEKLLSYCNMVVARASKLQIGG